MSPSQRQIIVGFEHSQAFTAPLVAAGFDVVSVDLLPCSGPFPEHHIQADVFEVLSTGYFTTGIFFPPCTYLAKAQQWRLSRDPSRLVKSDDAVQVVSDLLSLDLAEIAIENPVGRLSQALRPPDQIIYPHWFGDSYTKEICLWLKNLPPLLATYQYSGKLKRVANHVNSRMSQEQKSIIKSSWSYYPCMVDAMHQQWFDCSN